MIKVEPLYRLYLLCNQLSNLYITVPITKINTVSDVDMYSHFTVPKRDIIRDIIFHSVFNSPADNEGANKMGMNIYLHT